ncbi:MAG: nickel-binding protein [Actinomycetota bacterium]
MSLYMDRHDLPEATPEAVAQAHIKDLEIQEKYGVRYMTYWFDSDSGTVFCLAEAPSAEATEAVHRESHGLIAHQIIEVDGRTVVEFLGRLREPKPGEPWVATAFRTILFTDMEGSTALTQQLGDARALAVMKAHDAIVRQALKANDGSEVDHAGDGIMASFTSVVRAIECAMTIQRKIAEHNETAEVPFRVRMGISAGEPVTESDRLFGATIQLAARTCACAEGNQIFASNVVRELCVGKGFEFQDRGPFPLKGFDEPVQLFEVSWQSA